MVWFYPIIGNVNFDVHQATPLSNYIFQLLINK
jgi:hypothetical protein